ncbi:MAG: hypothetical protein K5754_00040, partial [Butyrivibrio sp.]|nr:hypothetical protein [Butyrivibrio sp.]
PGQKLSKKNALADLKSLKFSKFINLYPNPCRNVGIFDIQYSWMRTYGICVQEDPRCRDYSTTHNVRGTFTVPPHSSIDSSGDEGYGNKSKGGSYRDEKSVYGTNAWICNNFDITICD